MNTNDGWTPSNIEEGWTLASLPRRQSKVTLTQSENAYVRRIGEFCNSVPDDYEPQLAALGGVFIGLGLARARPDLVDQLLADAIATGKGNDDTFVRNVVRSILRDAE